MLPIFLNIFWSLTHLTIWAKVKQILIFCLCVHNFEPSREKFLSFLDKVEGKWDNPHFRKAWSYFEKQFGTALNGNQNTLNRKLYGFGHERKRKNSQEIPVGSQHVARRKFNHRGKSAAPAGRRPKPTVDKPVMFPRHIPIFLFV